MIRAVIHERALQSPASPAILAPGRATLSYGELEDAIHGLQAKFSALGLEASDRVALVCSNGPAMAISFLAIADYASCAPLNPAYRGNEFEFYLSDLEPRAIVLEAGLDSAIREVARARGIPVFELTPDLQLHGAASEVPRIPRDANEVALLLHTSGTTSRPKLIQLTRGNLLASAKNIARSLELTPEDRCLNVMPLFHVHGLVGALLSSIVSGGSVICSPGFVAPKFFAWVAEFRPTWYTAVPTIHQSVVARAVGIEGHSFRFIRSCSAALAPSLMQEMETIFRVPVVEAYGMTEAAHQMASNPLPPRRRKPGSVGVAAGPEISIIEGEVAVRGPNVYTDGWFRTGDQGYLDEEGYLFLTGRSKEIINRGGEKIAPREIDEVLLQHPAVAQAVAFAVPHQSLGEAVAAAVVWRHGLNVTESALREFAAERLADFKVPEKLVFLEEIPKGPTGKIQRIGLAEKLGIGEIPVARSAQANFVAPRTNVEKKIALLVAAALGVQRVGLHDNFFDLGGDSLLLTALLAKIRESTGVDVALIRFLQDPTVHGVCERLQQAAESQALGIVVRAGALPALFCIPGSHGNLVGFFRLAQHLGTEQPVTAFQLPKVQSGGAGYTVEGLAARYVSELLALQPEGPYYLAGACTGGMVAYEMAHQLWSQGKTVGLLALMDCYYQAADGVGEKIGYRVGLLRKRFNYHRRRLSEAGVSGSAAYLRPRLLAFAHGLRERAEELAYGGVLRMGLPLATGGLDPRLAIRRAAAAYEPPDWPGPLELFCVEEPRVDAYDYPQMGWEGKAQGGARVHQLPGSHMAMLSEPCVVILANQLRDCMAGLAGCGEAEPFAGAG